MFGFGIFVPERKLFSDFVYIAFACLLQETAIAKKQKWFEMSEKKQALGSDMKHIFIVLSINRIAHPVAVASRTKLFTFMPYI
jgi:hypothetical protein